MSMVVRVQFHYIHYFIHLYIQVNVSKNIYICIPILLFYYYIYTSIHGSWHAFWPGLKGLSNDNLLLSLITIMYIMFSVILNITNELI